jgi:hypothetical protein
MTPNELADKVARSMLAAEGTGPAWGVEIEEAREGYARIRMTLRPDMLNGHGIAQAASSSRSPIPPSLMSATAAICAASRPRPRSSSSTRRRRARC